MAITTLESLREHLQFAMAIERTTIPPYLCALYSIKEGSNQEAAQVIQSVAMEEMLHMVLVANLTNAVGGHVLVNAPQFVAPYPCFLPHSNRSFEVQLQKFSPEALDLFMQIEKPEASHAIPQDNQFATIGQFYAAVQEGLKYLVGQLGAEKVFASRNQRMQVAPGYYYGGSGELFEIHDLPSAIRAIQLITDQGEGLPHTISAGTKQVRPSRERHEIEQFGTGVDPAHYFRFQEIREERFYVKGDRPRTDKPNTGPTGPVFPVDWKAVWPMRPNPKASEYDKHPSIQRKLNEFNGCYMRLLNVLQLAFTGRPEALTAGVSEMYEMKQRAIELMRVPSPLDDEQSTVGPSFEYVAPQK